MEHKEVFFFFMLCCSLRSLDYIYPYFVEVWECSKPLLNFFFFHRRHGTTSQETVTAAITAVPLAWKAAVLQWQERSSLNSATACYRLLCPLTALYIGDNSFLLPYKTEHFGWTVFTSGNARMSTSMSGIAGQSFIHLPTKNKHS